MKQNKKDQFKEIDQQVFTDSFNICWELLKEKEYYLCERKTDIYSKLSSNYGQDMYDAMVTFMKKIIISNKHKAAIEKSKVESIKIVTTEATCDLGYDDNSDRFNQEQQQQVDQVNIDINNSLDKMISKKRKIPVDEIHSKKMFKADHKKNDLIGNLCMIDYDEDKKVLFTEDGATIKDEMLPTTDDSIDVDEINNLDNHSIGLEIKSNEMANYFESIFFKDDYQSCSDEVIENADHQKNTRIRTGSLAPKKYSSCTEEDDKLSFTEDDDDDDDDDDEVADDDMNNLNKNRNKNLKGKTKIVDDISFEEKKRVVKLAIENPTWPINMLRKHSGYKNIQRRSQVEKWKKQIEQGGSLREKLNFLNEWVLNKCIENQKKGELITNKKIRTWGLEAKKNFKPMKFVASDGWITMFKNNHEITGEPDNLKINCNIQRKKSSSYSRIFVPHEMKIKVVNLANENPHWSLEMLRKQSGCNNLENIPQLNYWKRVVSDFDKKRVTNLSNKKKKILI